MHELEPYLLWLGHSGDGRDLPRILEVGIEAVVQVAIEETPLPLPREMVCLRFPVRDGDDNPEELLEMVVEVLASLIRHRVPTLVCCGAGMSRSPAIAAAAIGRVTGEAAGDVLKRVLADRPGDVSPALWGQLRELG